jgi:hypothetical protein
MSKNHYASTLDANGEHTIDTDAPFEWDATPIESANDLRISVITKIVNNQPMDTANLSEWAKIEYKLWEQSAQDLISMGVVAEVLQMAQTSQDIRVEWNKNNTKLYTFRVLIKSDLYKNLEGLKGSRGRIVKELLEIYFDAQDESSDESVTDVLKNYFQKH